jgi:hypothetical protein
MIEALHQLPAEATVEGAIDRLLFLAKIDAGLAELDRGDGTPHDEVARGLGDGPSHCCAFVLVENARETVPDDESAGFVVVDFGSDAEPFVRFGSEVLVERASSVCNADDLRAGNSRALMTSSVERDRRRCPRPRNSGMLPAPAGPTIADDEIRACRSGSCNAPLLAALVALACKGAYGGNPPSGVPPASAPRPTLPVIATAPLDAQWLWTIQDTINECTPATLRDNLAPFKRYPDYVFDFERSLRYRLAREYNPNDYARLVESASAGRWHVSGGSIDVGDVDMPAPESLIRHVLLANRDSRKEPGQESTDAFLPDCFGFGWALPTVAVHCRPRRGGSPRPS